MTTFARRRVLFTGGMLAGALAFCVPAVAHAHGELQEGRFFLGGGPAVLAPASGRLDAVVDPSPGAMLEAGYLLGFGKDRGRGHFGLAPFVSLRAYDLADDLGGDTRSTWATHATTGVKAGFVGKGAFLYGLTDVGLAATTLRVCPIKGPCDTSRSEVDPMMRMGAGVDFTVHKWVAVGGMFAVPLIFSRDGRGIDENETALETTVYGKFLFPEPGRKVAIEVTPPSVKVEVTD